MPELSVVQVDRGGDLDVEKETCHGRPHSEKLRLWLEMEA